MLKKILCGSALLLSCAAPMLSHASVGSAGCGLGSLVFNGNVWWKQVLAATTNGTSGTQTFGITSGTSNCAPGLFGYRQKQQDYMVANFTTLQREAAQGTGDSISGLASVMGCKENSYGNFAAYTQSKYSAIFSSQDPTQVLNNLVNEVQASPELANSCSLAI